jgi:nitrate reductase cytochrome c-type subunit
VASNICLALHAGSSSVEQVANWIVEHEGDADIDEPLLVGPRRYCPQCHPMHFEASFLVLSGKQYAITWQAISVRL